MYIRMRTLKFRRLSATDTEDKKEGEDDDSGEQEDLCRIASLQDTIMPILESELSYLDDIF